MYGNHKFTEFHIYEIMAILYYNLCISDDI